MNNVQTLDGSADKRSGGVTLTLIGAIMGTVSTLFVYFILIAALQKLYAIGKDLAEIRDVLKEFRREREATSAVAGTYSPPSPWPSGVGNGS